MPVYNGEPYVSLAVQSILDQTFTDYEFIVVDDGSTDNTWSILQSYAAADPRIRLLQTRTNLGVASALNRGLAVARGEYIARMDADDISVPTRLSTQLSFLDDHPSIGVVGSELQIIDAHGAPVRHLHRPKTNTLIMWALCFRSPLAHPSVMMRRALLLAVGGYEDSLLTAQDRDLWQRMSSITRFANLPDPLLLHRRHSKTVTRELRSLQMRNSAEAGQRMISTVLGREVPFPVCHGMELGTFDSADEALLAVELIGSIYATFLAKASLSSYEEHRIRSDAAARLVALSWRWLGDHRIRLHVGALAHRLGLHLVTRAALQRAVEKAAYTLRSRLQTRRPQFGATDYE